MGRECDCLPKGLSTHTGAATGADGRLAWQAEEEAAARQAEREAERLRKEQEREYAEKMRHMLKVRALEKSRVVDVNLATAREPDGSVRVRLHMCMATNMTSVTRLADGIAKLMDEYDWTNKGEAFKKGHRWMQLLDSIELGLQRNVGETFAVRSSCGCGGWAKVPWIAVSEPRESTQAGLYMQYLFRADMSAVYLCLGQGTSKLKAALGQQAAVRHMEHVAEFVRGKFGELATQGELEGWDTKGDIDLRAGSGGLAADYQKACIISRIYEHGANLDEATLLKELDEMLNLYTAVLSDPKYQLDIKAPIEEQLQASGVMKSGKGRKSGGAGGAGNGAGAGGSAETGLSAGQKRAAAREAAAATSSAMAVDADDEDGEDGGAREGAGSGSAGAWWLHGDRAADGTPGVAGPAAKRLRRESVGKPKSDEPASGGSGGKAATKGKSKGGAGAGAAVGPKGKGASPANSAALARLTYEWPVGLRVEVLQESEEHFGAWFEARVLEHKAPDKLKVEYEELCDEVGEDEDDVDGQELPGLQQLELVRKVRPLPMPPVHADWVHALKVGDIVQLAYIGGWWDVQVMQLRAQQTPPQWVVKSVHFEATHTVDASQLRPQPKWYWDMSRKSWLERGREAEMIARMEQARAAATESASAEKQAAPASTLGKVPRTAAAADDDGEVEVHMDVEP